MAKPSVPTSMIPRVFVMMMRDDKILLMRQRETPASPSMYTLPHVTVNENEKMLAACGRGLRNEAGVKSVNRIFRLVHVLRHVDGAGDHIDFFYETRVWDSYIKIGNFDVYDEALWINIDDVPENTDAYVYDFIVYSFPKSTFFAELGWGRNRIAKVYTKVTWF